MVEKIKVNPEYSGLVPPLAKETFDSLVRSIQANGQHEPITVNEDGVVIDGHNRLRACEKLALTPDFKVKKFDNPLQEKLYVIDINLQRRQLTPAQRIQLSLQKKPLLEELAKNNESLGGRDVQICTPLNRVNEVIAKDAGVSARQVSKFETISKKAGAQLLNRVLTAKTIINKAYNDIKAEEKRKHLIEQAKQAAAAKLLIASNKNKPQYELFEGDFRAVAPTKLSDNSIDDIH